MAESSRAMTKNSTTQAEREKTETDGYTTKDKAVALLKLKGWQPGDKLHAPAVVGLMVEFANNYRPEDHRCAYPACGCDFDAICNVEVCRRDALPHPNTAGEVKTGEREALVDALEAVAQDAHDQGYHNGFADARNDNQTPYDYDALTDGLDPECRRDSWYEGERHDALTKIVTALSPTSGGGTGEHEGYCATFWSEKPCDCRAAPSSPEDIGGAADAG